VFEIVSNTAVFSTRLSLVLGTKCVHVSTAMLTKCVGEGMGKLIRNNQVQVFEVLPLYVKGTGQQGVC